MKSKLDDANFIINLDPDDALGVAAESHTYLALELPSHSFKKPQNVVFAGMGGSALSAVLAKNWLGPELPVSFEYVRGYTLPAYVGTETLVIVSSYSGNTEETVSCFDQAVEKGAQIAIITKGGVLLDRAQSSELPLYELPETSQPRFSTLASLNAVVAILEAAGLTEGKTKELKEASGFLKNAIEQWVPENVTENNRAKQLALELAGKSVVVWGGPLLSAAAYKWKISMNENAKNLAFWNEWPEFNHNEFIGWSSHPVEKVYGIVELISKFEHPRIKERFEISNRLLSGRMPAPYLVEAEGESSVKELLWSVVLGDFVSLYLAILNGNNPTPVDLVEKLKQELS